MNEDLRREVERWCRFAAEDLRESKRLTQRKDAVPRHAAWLAQQAAEKAIKAALIFLQVEFPRTHNLNTLQELIPADWRVKHVAADLARLSEYAVEARYPGDVPDISAQEAAGAAKDAAFLVEAALSDLDARMTSPG